MTNTYKTGNPLGSFAAKDMYDNASNFDEGMNSPEPSFKDRFDKRRQSWAGMEKLIEDAVANVGFEPAHLIYTVGSPLVVSRPTQLIDYLSSSYRVNSPAVFPVTLTGVWATDVTRLTQVVDANLRAELASSSGAGIVGYGASTVGATLDSQVAALAVLDGLRESTLVDTAASRSLVIGDAYKLLRANNVANKVFTIPAQASVAWGSETEISFYNESGATLTLAAASGVTIKVAYGGALIIPAGGFAWLKRIELNTWLLVTKGVTASPKLFVGAKAWGDSITVGTGASRPSLAYISQESETVQVPFTNYAQSGACVWDQATAVYGQNLAVNEAGQLMIGTNDSRTYGTAVANDLTVFKRGHAALLAWIATPEAYKTRANSASITYTSVWDAGTAYGGTWIRVTTVSGATATFTFFGPVLYLSTTRLGSSSAKGEVRIDGVLVGTTSSIGLSASTPLGAYLGPSLYRFAGLANTTHTVVITVIDANTSNAFFLEWFSAPSNVTRFVNLINIPRMTGGSTADAKTTAYNAAILDNYTTMKADGLKLALADAFAVIDPATDLADGLHPNDAGHTKIAAVASASFQS